MAEGRVTSTTAYVEFGSGQPIAYVTSTPAYVEFSSGQPIAYVTMLCAYVEFAPPVAAGGGAGSGLPTYASPYRAIRPAMR